MRATRDARSGRLGPAATYSTRTTLGAAVALSAAVVAVALAALYPVAAAVALAAGLVTWTAGRALGRRRVRRDVGQSRQGPAPAAD